MLDRLAERAAERGVTATLHPHVGTMVETRDDVLRVLDGASVPLCLDTGHLLIGGTDPLELASAASERIAHTHLKDVDAALAARVRAGELSYTSAVRAGMYRPLGRGDIDIDIGGIVTTLESFGYDGWYVLERTPSSRRSQRERTPRSTCARASRFSSTRSGDDLQRLERLTHVPVFDEYAIASKAVALRTASERVAPCGVPSATDRRKL